jgi:hypothetical protein
LYFSDILLFDFLLVDLLDRIGQVVVQVDPVGTHEDDVRPHRQVGVVGQTVTIEEHHLPDLEILGVVEGVAIEALDQGFLLVVPEGESVGGGDEGKPLFFGVEGHQLDFLRQVDVEVENDFVPVGHCQLADNLINYCCLIIITNYKCSNVALSIAHSWRVGLS